MDTLVLEIEYKEGYADGAYSNITVKVERMTPRDKPASLPLSLSSLPLSLGRLHNATKQRQPRFPAPGGGAQANVVEESVTPSQ